MRQLQTLSGGVDAPPGTRGNCYQTCLANLLELPLAQVPHAFDGTRTRDAAWVEIDAWLASRALRRERWSWEQVISGDACIGSAETVIAVGRAPGRTHLHAVLADRVHSCGWRLVHDPSPRQRSLEPELRYIERIVRC